MEKKMEKEKVLKGTNSYVGPLAAAEDSAGQFVAGLIYCDFLEKVVLQQEAVNAILESNASEAEKVEAVQTNEDLEKVWLVMSEEFGYEC